ncbi:MAG: gamma carbonic anhydrase family protein, partial [Alphaproteobacteria bacterium]|nr:gamma carbonic anhydrase family protein [Alphaproteobacteria bacterium]
MRFRHRSKTPVVDPSANVAPTAVLAGDVQVGAGCAIGFGAVLSAEDGAIVLGRDRIFMENAVVLATERAHTKIGDNVLVGPRAYLTGCTIEDCVFLATGSTIFNHARIGRGAEVRINGTVHLHTNLPDNATVPIGWVAIGNPAQILAPNEHEKIWEIQKTLDFPKAVFNLERPPKG